ncbi:MAG: hypothetical protein MJZ73_11470 [Bacteroidaceae bacterium]|nr:hypothetical protein [Bacteroidaceae bacterium]
MILLLSLETILIGCFILIPLVIIWLLLRPVFRRFEAIEKEVDKELGLKDRYSSAEELRRELERLRRMNLIDDDLFLDKEKDIRD